jgi:hypothetical protein
MRGLCLAPEEDGCPPLGASPDALLYHPDTEIWEAVEVKNVCPFGATHKRKMFRLVEAPPADHLRPEWVPQIQLHMACTDTQSAILVSRSVTNGSRIFRVERSNEYIDCMKRVLQLLWTVYITKNKSSPRNIFFDHQEYQRLLKLTLQCMKQSKVIIETCDSWDNGDSFFLG